MVHGPAQGPLTHLPLAVLRVELKPSVQLAIPVIQDAPCPTFAFLEGMTSAEIVSKFVCERPPIETMQ